MKVYSRAFVFIVQVYLDNLYCCLAIQYVGMKKHTNKVGSAEHQPKSKVDRGEEEGGEREEAMILS